MSESNANVYLKPIHLGIRPVAHSTCLSTSPPRSEFALQPRSCRPRGTPNPPPLKPKPKPIEYVVALYDFAAQADVAEGGGGGGAFFEKDGLRTDPDAAEGVKEEAERPSVPPPAR